MDNILEKLKTFIISQRWEYDFPIARETSLQDELLIYGDDADEFILAFSKQFNVGVKEFRIGDYFRGEYSAVRDIIDYIKGKDSSLKKRLTVGHLEKAVIAGKLNEEVINGS